MASDPQSNEDMGCLIYGLGALVGVGALLYFLGHLQISTTQCRPVPIDLVIADTCVVETFGPTLAVAAVTTIAIAFGTFVIGLIAQLFRSKR